MSDENFDFIDAFLERYEEDESDPITVLDFINTTLESFEKKSELIKFGGKEFSLGLTWINKSSYEKESFSKIVEYHKKLGCIDNQNCNDMVGFSVGNTKNQTVNLSSVPSLASLVVSKKEKIQKEFFPYAFLYKNHEVIVDNNKYEKPKDIT